MLVDFVVDLIHTNVSIKTEKKVLYHAYLLL